MADLFCRSRIVYVVMDAKEEGSDTSLLLLTSNSSRLAMSLMDDGRASSLFCLCTTWAIQKTWIEINPNLRFKWRRDFKERIDSGNSSNSLLSKAYIRIMNEPERNNSREVITRFFRETRAETEGGRLLRRFPENFKFSRLRSWHKLIGKISNWLSSSQRVFKFKSVPNYVHKVTLKLQ